MRLLIQRVKEAHVATGEKICGQIRKGMLVFLGIHKNDTSDSIEWMVKKLIGLRIFSDAEGKMNLDILQTQGEILIVSQFTLYGNCQNGKRPDFIEAAPSETAHALYHEFVQKLSQEFNKNIQTGEFGAYMEVSLVNDGPVTFLLER
jgi:D-tyrosyl-tRNA(Tyr) deacylase